MIPLMKNAFLNEAETKKALANFILKADRLSMDEQCFAFERRMASFQGQKHAVLFNSGGSANLAMFQTLKNTGRLQDRARVGFSALTWSTNVMPIIQMGLEPVPVDCSPKTLNVMADTLDYAIKTRKLDAFFITNALGFAGDLDEIRALCKEKQIIFLEDNCEALGTVIGSKKTGTFGEMASFSFFVAHHMSTIEGGMVCTDDDELANMLRIVRANGWDRNLDGQNQSTLRKVHNIKDEFAAKYTFYDLGFNFRPTEITGFIGNYQIQYLAESVLKRERNYLELEAVISQNHDLIAPDHSHISTLSCFATPILAKTPELRDAYVARFLDAEIEIRPVISGNIVRQPFFKKYCQEEYSLPGTDFIHDCGFYCGNYPELTAPDLDVMKKHLR